MFLFKTAACALQSDDVKKVRINAERLKIMRSAHSVGYAPLHRSVTLVIEVLFLVRD